MSQDAILCPGIIGNKPSLALTSGQSSRLFPPQNAMRRSQIRFANLCINRIRQKDFNVAQWLIPENSSRIIRDDVRPLQSSVTWVRLRSSPTAKSPPNSLSYAGNTVDINSPGCFVSRTQYRNSGILRKLPSPWLNRSRREVGGSVGAIAPQCGHILHAIANYTYSRMWVRFCRHPYRKRKFDAGHLFIYLIYQSVMKYTVHEMVFFHDSRPPVGLFSVITPLGTKFTIYTPVMGVNGLNTPIP